MEKDIIRDMLATIRSKQQEEDSSLIEELEGRGALLTEDAASEGKVSVKITNNTKEFGDIRTNQEDSIKKTIGQNVEFSDDDGLVFYPEDDDLVMNGEIKSIGLTFQFRYAEPSGDGLFIWSDGLQLTEANNRIIGKLRDAFLNWKDSITQDDNLIKKLKQAYEREKR